MRLLAASNVERWIVLLPAIVIGAGLVFGVLILLGRAFAVTVRESGHPRLILAGLLEVNELDGDETADLVELAAEGRIEEPRSPLGRYLVRHWERISLVEGESLVYWLRKLIFRGAWLDHRVKESLLEVVWDDDNFEFAYRDPRGGRALLELAPVPSWHELQYKG